MPRSILAGYFSHRFPPLLKGLHPWQLPPSGGALRTSGGPE